MQEFLKEQDKSEKKEVSDKYIEVNNEEEYYKQSHDQLFDSIKIVDEEIWEESPLLAETGCDGIYFEM